MKSALRLFVPLLIIGCCCAATLAQTDDDPYASTPQSRADDGAFVLGQPAAEMSLLLFSDYLCVSCQHYQDVVEVFIRDHVLTGDARLEFRALPAIDPQLSLRSANLVECAAELEPGSFWRAHKLMFDIVRSVGFSEAATMAFAAELDLEADALNECAESGERSQPDLSLARQLGVQSAPSLFIQYGEAAPLPIALALPEHFPAIARAIRPESSDAAIIESGPYAGLQTFRRGDGGFVLGAPDAPVTLVAFEDFLCGHCQAYQPTLAAFIERHVRSGQAQFEYRFYPLVDKTYSTLTAKTAECVAVQDLRRFWEGHDLLFAYAAAGSLDDLGARVATALGLDEPELKACLERAMQFLVDAQLATLASVSGTPALRARQANGPIELIHFGGEAHLRGGLNLEALSLLADGDESVSIGAPEALPAQAHLLEDSSLTSGEPCAAPCWRGISPGETSLTEARNLLEAAGFVATGGDRGGFQFGLPGQPACCEIRQRLEQEGSDADDAVAVIHLALAPLNRLGDVIDAHGEPTYVLPQPGLDGGDSLITLVFAESRMLLDIRLAADHAPLDASSAIVYALYMSPEILSEGLATLQGAPTWQGYLSAEAYLESARISE